MAPEIISADPNYTVKVDIVRTMSTVVRYAYYNSINSIRDRRILLERGFDLVLEVQTSYLENEVLTNIKNFFLF